MNEPEWVLKETVIGLHEMSLNDHGGSSGMRDEGMLDSAVGKPLNQSAYGNPNLFDLAVSYAYGIIKSHPFIDGNKRTEYCEAGALSGLAEHPAR